MIEAVCCQPIESSNAFGCPGLISKKYVEFVYNEAAATILVIVPIITLTLEVATFPVAVASTLFITLGFAII